MRNEIAYFSSILLFIAGCSTSTTQSFRVADAPDIDAAFVATDADFSKYRQLYADDMGIFFPKNSPLTEEELQRIRRIFREAFFSELANYKVVSRPGPETLAVQASLIDLRKAGDADVPTLRAEIRNVPKPGELLFLMELRDSQTNRVLGRAADGTPTPILAASDDGAADWSGVEAAARRWASSFRRFLDNNLGR